MINLHIGKSQINDDFFAFVATKVFLCLRLGSRLSGRAKTAPSNLLINLLHCLIVLITAHLGTEELSKFENAFAL